MASQPQIRAAERLTAKETTSAPAKEQEKPPDVSEPAAESEEEVCAWGDLCIPNTVSCPYYSGGVLISEVVL